MSNPRIEEVIDEPTIDRTVEETAEDVENGEVPAGADVVVHNRNEKKARQSLVKLGLKPVPGITRVFFKRSRNMMFTIQNPEVYKSPAGVYIVFGEAKVDNQSADMAARLAAIQSQAVTAGGMPQAPTSKDPASITADLEAAVANTTLTDSGEPVAEEEDDDEVDTTGISEDDIKIIMDQGNVSKAKAVASLRKNNGDIVNTIMELTS